MGLGDVLGEGAEVMVIQVAVGLAQFGQNAVQFAKFFDDVPLALLDPVLHPVVELLDALGESVVNLLVEGVEPTAVVVAADVGQSLGLGEFNLVQVVIGRPDQDGNQGDSVVHQLAFRLGEGVELSQH